VIGNPPFGRQSALCHKFIRHASNFVDSFSFILPISFKKQYNVSKIPRYFHLVKEILLPKNAFILDNTNYAVPTVFQIWQKKETRRLVPPSQIPKGFAFVEKSQASFSICRTGNAGLATTTFQHKKKSHNYFVKLLVSKDLDEVVRLFNKTRIIERDFNIGAPSLSRQEIIPYLNDIINI